jgi:hypothetical protein
MLIFMRRVNTGIIDLLYIAIAFLIFSIMWGEYGAERLKKWYKSRNILQSIFLGIFLSIVTSFVMIIDNLLYVEKTVELRGALLAVNITVAVLLGPVIEELVYRGVIIDILGRWFSSFVCVGASALVFSLVHIPEGFVDFLLVFLVGVCFGVVYIVDGNLIPSTIAHSLSNAAVLIFIR